MADLTQEAVNETNVLETPTDVVIETAENTESNVIEQTQTQTAPIVETQITETATKKTIEELLAEHGYKEELDIISKAKEQKAHETQETEKPFSETKAWADTVSFAAKNKLATQEDFMEHKRISGLSDEELAFSKYKLEHQSDEDYEDLSTSELEDTLRAEFNEKYFIGAENEMAQKIGQTELKKLADEIRKPINDKILSVQSRMITNAMSDDHRAMTESIAKTPLKKTIEIVNNKGEKEAIEVEFTPKVDFSEVAEYLKSDEGSPILNVLYDTYKGNREQGMNAFKDFLETRYSSQNVQSIAQSLYEKGLAVGKSLAVGSKTPFNSKENFIKGVPQSDAPIREYRGGRYTS